MLKNGIVILTDENFQKEVIECPLPVLVEHGTNWPFPIELLVSEILNELAIEFEGQIKVARFDINESSYSVDKFNLWKFPCILIFMGGRVVDKTSIVVQKAVLTNKLRELLNPLEISDFPHVETQNAREGRLALMTKEKLLIAAYDEDVRSIMHNILDDAGYSIDCTGNGKTVLSMINEKPYHLVILEDELYGLPGLKVLDNMRQSKSTSKVIMFCSIREDSIRAKARALGVWGFLDKPFDVEMFLRTVEKTLSQKQNRCSELALKGSNRAKNVRSGQQKG